MTTEDGGSVPPPVTINVRLLHNMAARTLKVQTLNLLAPAPETYQTLFEVEDLDEHQAFAFLHSCFNATVAADEVTGCTVIHPSLQTEGPDVVQEPRWWIYHFASRKEADAYLLEWQFRTAGWLRYLARQTRQQEVARAHE